MDIMAKKNNERPEEGASSAEYGLLVSGIAALIAIVVFAFGGVIGDLFTNSCGTIGAKLTTATCAP
jgi:pilus assembly protein Flp/PilA